MTNEMRERVETAVNTSEGNLTIEFAKEAIEMKKRQLTYWETKRANDAVMHCKVLNSDIAYFEAVIEYLTEKEVAAVVNEAVQALTVIATVANKAKAVRKAVVTLANKLHRLSYSLSDAFKKAWTFINSFKGLLPSQA